MVWWVAPRPVYMFDLLTDSVVVELLGNDVDDMQEVRFGSSVLHLLFEDIGPSEG